MLRLKKIPRGLIGCLNNEKNITMIKGGVDPVGFSTRNMVDEVDVDVQSVDLLSSKEIKKIMDEKVVGQYEAKKDLSILLSMHMSWNYKDNPRHPAPNAILVGPTGSGKTYSIEVASSGIGIPFIKIDATTITPSGAASGVSAIDLSNLVAREAGNYDKCVVFLDEFDKLAAPKDDKHAGWKRDIQKSLLKFIEGQSLSLNATPKALVLVGGAFQGIEQMERLRKPEVIRLMRKAPSGTFVADDLINYGFMPELIARLPCIIQLKSLSQKVLLDILNHPESSPLQVWRNHFSSIGKEIVFDESFLNEVASRASSLGLGARGLHQIVFPVLSRKAYDFESSAERTIQVDKSYLNYAGVN